MATGLSATIANAWLDGLGNASNWTAPTACWIKLHTGDPGAAGTSNAATETTRKQASFAAASAGAITTDADLSWTSMAANETISHISAWDASTAGTFLFSDALDTSRAVTSGGSFTIATGDIDMNITAIAA